MAEKPIIICTELIPATMDGRKTVTRRVIKPQPEFDAGKCLFPIKWKKQIGEINELYCDNRWSYDGNISCQIYKAPYQVGDILWVKETLERYREDDTNYYELRYRSDKKQVLADEPKNWNPQYQWHIGITGDIQFIPSIHMPKWAACIWLKVLDVRPEKLQEITEEDAIKEGMYPEGFEIKLGLYADDPIEQFAQLWDSLNAKRGYSWESNPWVWRTEFERFERKEYFKQGS